MADKDINTGGGTSVEGNVDTGSGHFIGRDYKKSFKAYINGNPIVAILAILVGGTIAIVAMMIMFTILKDGSAKISLNHLQPILTLISVTPIVAPTATGVSISTEIPVYTSINCSKQASLATSDDYYKHGKENFYKSEADWNCAESDFKQAIKLGLNNNEVYYYLGIISFVGHKNYDLTVEYLTQLIEFGAGDVETHTLAVVYYVRGVSYRYISIKEKDLLRKNTSLDNAIADFKSALVTEKDWLPPKCFLGVAYAQKGITQTASEFICPCIKNTSPSLELQLAITEAKQTAEQYGLCQTD